MKKTLLFFLALIVISTISFARRLDNPPALSRMGVIRSGSTFKVFYKGTSLSKVVINIYSNNKVKVFSDNLGKQDSFVRPYNFSQLPEGEYTIELTDETGKQVQRVQYRNGKIEKLASLIKVSGEGDKYLLMVPSEGADVLDIEISDAAGEVIYRSKEKIEGDFARVYDLKSLSGIFELSITDSKGVTKTISYY
jgi:hypothetical protein